MNSSFIKQHWAITLIAFIFMILGVLRLNDVSLYTPDSSRYLIWGNSIAHGKGFVDDTQPEVDRFVINAPLYAAVIAPVEKVFPLSITAVKFWTLCWGALAVVLFYFFLSGHVGKKYALLGAAVLACNPAMLLFSTEMLSEAPFIVAVLAILILSERSAPGSPPESNAVVILLVAFLAFLGLLREVGIALVLASVLYFYSLRKFKRALIIIASTALVLGAWYYRNQVWVSAMQGPQNGNLSIISERFLTQPGAPLYQEIGLRIWASLNVYASHLGEMLVFTGFSRQLSDVIAEPSGLFRLLQSLTGALNIPLAIICLGLGIAGVRADLRRSATSWLRMIFVLVFILIILAYPVHDIRFLLPLTPLVIWYLGLGLSSVFRFFLVTKTRLVLAIPFFLGAIVILPNCLALSELLRTNQAYCRSPQELIRSTRFISSLYTYDWQTVRAWIETGTNRETVFASPMKELAVIADGRKVVDLDPGTPLANFEDALRDYHVEYLLAVVQGDLNVYEFQMTQSRRFRFEPVCDAGNLHLVRVRERNLDRDVSAKLFSPADTVASIRLMRLGRQELLRGKYADAETTLVRAYRRFPRHPVIVYETMTAALMAGDTTTAAVMYANLMALPQTMSYSGMARMHLDAMAFMKTSLHSGMLEERAVTRNKAASLYWKLGYYLRAAEVMDTLLDGQSNYFVGLLWGMHYNLQNGDTVKARKFLAEVLRVDSVNVVGKAFMRLFRIGDSVQFARSDSERSALHMALARLYLLIDLKNEAVDEAERALAADPGNREAVPLIGQVYEKKGRPKTAIAIYRTYAETHPGEERLRIRADSLQQKLAQ